MYLSSQMNQPCERVYVYHPTQNDAILSSGLNSPYATGWQRLAKMEKTLQK